MRPARDKHCNLLRTFENYVCKKFYDIGPWRDFLVFEQRREDVDNNISGFCYKLVTTVIYDRNDSGLANVIKLFTAVNYDFSS